MVKHISLVNALSAAWDTYRNNLRFFLIVSAVTSGIFFLLMLLAGLVVFGSTGFVIPTFKNIYDLKKIALAAVPSGFLFLIAQALYGYQLLCFGLCIYQGKKPSWESFFTLPSSTFIRFFLARMVYVLFSTLGFLLFIIPGIYYMTSHYFAGYSILYGETDSVGKDSTQTSVLTKGNRWRLLLFIILTLAFTSPSGILFIFTLPFVVLMTIDLYNQLKVIHEGTLTPP